MNHLSPKTLHAQSLAAAVPAIPGTSLSFFMSHDNLPKTFQAFLLYADLFDPQGGEGLTMSLLLGISLAPFHLEDNDLFAPRLGQDFSHDPDIGKQGLPRQDPFPVGIEKHIFELNRFARLAGDFLHPYGVALRNFILFSAGTDYRVHFHPPE
jgi:hypothetical protein